MGKRKRGDELLVFLKYIMKVMGKIMDICVYIFSVSLGLWSLVLGGAWAGF